MYFIKENKRELIAVVIAVIFIGVGLFLLHDRDGNVLVKPYEDSSSNRQEIVENVTGMSGEDAVKLVKENFLGENFTFEAILSKDDLYKIVATNIVTGDKIIYFVDPVTGKYFVNID